MVYDYWPGQWGRPWGVCPSCGRCPSCGHGGYNSPYITWGQATSTTDADIRAQLARLQEEATKK